jgi:GMP synthase-like glutamine amidotransferase
VKQDEAESGSGRCCQFEHARPARGIAGSHEFSATVAVAGAAGKDELAIGGEFEERVVAPMRTSRVRKNECKEIGWLPVETFPEEDSVLAGLPAELTVFHWHGETYDLPPGSVLRARSEGCEVQAFELPHAAGLQFHLEVTGGGVEKLISCCGGEVGIGPYEQPADAMREGERVHGDQARRNLFLLLDRIAQRVECRCLHLGDFGG